MLGRRAGEGRLIIGSLGAAIAGLMLSAAPAMATAPDREDALQAFNRDVYYINGANLLNPDADTPGDERLYSNVGAALPVTWAGWQAASADSRVQTRSRGAATETDVRLRLTGLIAGGVYSVFYGTFGPDSEHPLCRGVERTLAVPLSRQGADNPDTSSFVADANGRFRYHGTVSGNVLAADQVFLSIVYHFDGSAWHPFPNRGEFFTQGDGCRSSFGEDAMRQLLILQKGFIPA